MRMGQGVWTGLGHGGITCVLQTQFSSFVFFCIKLSFSGLAITKQLTVLESEVLHSRSGNNKLVGRN